MRFERAYQAWQDYITKCVRLEYKRYRFGELDLDELVMDAWARIWEYWISVENAQKPVVAAGLLAKQAVTQAVIKIVGRKVNCRGKTRFWAGTRQRPALSQVLPMDKKTGEPNWGSDFVLASVGRGRRLDNPVVLAILHEELERFGFVPERLLRHYLGDGWQVYGRDPHLKGEILVA